MIEPNSYTASVKIALANYNEVDIALQYPVPPASKPILPPPGIMRRDFVDIIEAYVLHYELCAGLNEVTPRVIKEYVPRLSLKLIEKALATPQMRNMLVLRGVVKESGGLSGEQMRALQVMTEVSTQQSLSAKLKGAGIAPYKWQAWLNDPLFRAHHDRLANELFNKMQADVDTQVVQGAVAGKLEFIKYFNEISGKHDPNRRAHADVQTILNGIVEIVTRNVTDPTVLERISSELSAVVAKLG